jgi:alanyl-tRNA synthetase
MTKELLAEEGLSLDDQGFEELMERAREVSRAGKSRTRASADAGGGSEVHVEHDDVLRFARDAGFRTRFVGYETTEAETILRVAEQANGWLLAKLEESPFYPEGGGQISDSGLVETPSGRARVVDVYRVGDDQALALEPVEGELGAGESARAIVERDRRLATMRNHTATHLLHAALRERLGTHVRQAISPRWSGSLAAGWGRTTRCGPSRRPVTRRSGSAPWRCSGRSTASACGWWRSRACRASSAVAPTLRPRRRSACST